MQIIDYSISFNQYSTKYNELVSFLFTTISNSNRNDSYAFALFIDYDLRRVRDV